MSDPSPPQSEDQRFQQLLPFYVSGTIAAADRDFVDAYLADNPSSQNALYFTEQLSRVVRSIGVNRNPDGALEKLLHDLKPARQNLFQRILNKWRSAGRLWRIFIVLVAAALLRLASPEAWSEAIMGFLGELGLADAALLLM